MKRNKKAFILFIFAFVAVITASCTRIPYNDVVVPEFKKMHPFAETSQIYPIGGHGVASYAGGKTDIVIHFKEGGESLEELWTVTRKGVDWDVLFKCKSSGNVCVEAKSQSGNAK